MFAIISRGLNALTSMHLKTARAMPRKVHPVLYGDRAEKYAKQAKRERKAIAEYYRTIRRTGIEDHPGTGHRYGIVTTGAQAKMRLKAMAD